MGNLAENPDCANDVERLIGEMKRYRKLGDTVSLSTDNPKPKAINLTGKPRILDRWQPQWIREKYFGVVIHPSRTRLPAKNANLEGVSQGIHPTRACDCEISLCKS